VIYIGNVAQPEGLNDIQLRLRRASI